MPLINRAYKVWHRYHRHRNHLNHPLHRLAPSSSFSSSSIWKCLLWSCASLQYVTVGICSWENRKRIKLHVNCEAKQVLRFSYICFENFEGEKIIDLLYCKTYQPLNCEERPNKDRAVLSGIFSCYLQTPDSFNLMVTLSLTDFLTNVWIHISKGGIREWI